MAECGEISMMLGAFEDSELEPNEMQEVAYPSGAMRVLHERPRRLFEARTKPEIDHGSAFAGRFLERGSSSRRSAAAAGADQNRAFPQASVGVGRLRVRVGRRCRGGRNRHDNSDDAVRPRNSPIERPCRPWSPARITSRTGGRTAQLADATADEPTMADNDSHADISRLESENHSVAVWSEPRRDTTVIWLPDQP